MPEGPSAEELVWDIEQLVPRLRAAAAGLSDHGWVSAARTLEQCASKVDLIVALLQIDPLGP